MFMLKSSHDRILTKTVRDLQEQIRELMSNLRSARTTITNLQRNTPPTPPKSVNSEKILSIIRPQVAPIKRTFKKEETQNFGVKHG